MFVLDAANIQLFARGAWTAASVFSVTMALGLVLGTLLGIIAAQSERQSAVPLRHILNGFSFVFRGVPLIVQILYIYYGSSAFGIRPTRFLGAVIAFTGFATASVLEIVRAGVNSVPSGQWMAAQSLGMSQTSVLRYVILPQAIRVVIPPIVGFAAQLIKSTSIVSLIGSNSSIHPVPFFGSSARWLMAQDSAGPPSRG